MGCRQELQQAQENDDHKSQELGNGSGVGRRIDWRCGRSGRADRGGSLVGPSVSG